MLQPARRARAADRAAVAAAAELVEPRRLQQSPPGQPDLDPLAGDDLADRRQRRFRRSPIAAAASASALRRQRRQQLVVLAARGGQLERVAPGRGGDLGDARRPAAGRRRRSAGRRRWRSARWPASPPRPSLRSIIALAPAAARARPAASRGVGLELAARAAARRSAAGTAAASSGRFSSSRPAAAPPSSPVRTSASPGRAPPRRDQLLGAGARGRRR